MQDRADVYVAGPPCQEFSIAGGGEGSPDFFQKCVDFIKKHHPTIFLLENVEGLANDLFCPVASADTMP